VCKSEREVMSEDFKEGGTRVKKWGGTGSRLRGIFWSMNQEGIGKGMSGGISIRRGDLGQAPEKKSRRGLGFTTIGCGASGNEEERSVTGGRGEGKDIEDVGSGLKRHGAEKKERKEAGGKRE